MALCIRKAIEETKKSHQLHLFFFTISRKHNENELRKKKCFSFKRLENYDKRDLLDCIRDDNLVVSTWDVVCLRSFQCCDDIVVASLSKELFSIA